MNEMKSDPPSLFWILRGDMALIAYAKFKGFLTVGYFQNGRWVLDGIVTKYRSTPLRASTNAQSFQKI